MEAIYEVFDFIVSILSYIIEGFYNFFQLLGNLAKTISSIVTIIPSPFLEITLVGSSVLIGLKIFKLARKG